MGMVIYFWGCSFPLLVHLRESPEVTSLVAADKEHWPRFMLWHGWFSGLSGTSGFTLGVGSRRSGP